jgi:hypothetical protein
MKSTHRIRKNGGTVTINQWLELIAAITTAVGTITSITGSIVAIMKANTAKTIALSAHAAVSKHITTNAD